MQQEELEKLIIELTIIPKENEWLEFKSGNATSNEKIGHYISALSNSACINNEPFGYLVFGIEDETKKVVGTNYKFKDNKVENQELEIWLRKILHPSVNFEVFEFNFEKKPIVLFKVPATKGEPVLFKNIPYIRFGTSLTNLSKHPEHLRTIYNSQEDWSKKIIKEASLKDLDEEAVNFARKKFREKHAGTEIYDEIESWDDLKFLDKAKITINGNITNSALILLGKEESSHYLLPAVAQITWKLDTEEKAYEHFGIPFLTNINNVLKRIRNIKYKFFPDNQLLSVEVNKYESKVILEALNNCIAHQDYSRNSRIILQETKDKLIFSNAGSFFEGNYEEYSGGNKTPKSYRNRWLVEAMVNLNMIDTLGYGIHRMYLEQWKRYFPLPDYTKSSNDEVILEIYGNIIDENYSKLLIQQKENLKLSEVILIDKVQKNLPITDDAYNFLKKKKLIEGRKNNYYVSASIAKITNQKVSYTKNKGFSYDIIKNMIVEHINNHGSTTRNEIDTLIFDYLPNNLTEKQKKSKVHNVICKMSGTIIKNIGSKAKPNWILINNLK